MKITANIRTPLGDLVYQEETDVLAGLQKGGPFFQSFADISALVLSDKPETMQTTKVTR